jgi:SAM-dependent methyltransferase
VLELGIGTGRIALPLSRRGLRVHGIELSPAMIARLQAQEGGSDIGVTLGDFANAKVDETFTLAYLVRNTIMNLTTQEEQVDCFRNVAAHLEPGGRFVIEVMVPTLRQLPPGETVRAFTVTPTHLGFDEFVDLAAQVSVSHHYWVIDGQMHSSTRWLFGPPMKNAIPVMTELHVNGAEAPFGSKRSRAKFISGGEPTATKAREVVTDPVRYPAPLSPPCAPRKRLLLNQ